MVAEIDLELAGYAYATQFRDRPAYAGTCENSIYVAANWVGRGVGASLLAALIEKAAAYGFTQMIAVIGGAEPASVALHAKSGFVQAGRMRNVGRKFGKLLDRSTCSATCGAPEKRTTALHQNAKFRAGCFRPKLVIIRVRVEDPVLTEVAVRAG